MAEVKFGQGFELYDGLKEIRAICQMLIWQGLWGFSWIIYCAVVAGNAINIDVSRKCTLKIKYGLGSTTLLWKLIQIPIRD